MALLKEEFTLKDVGSEIVDQLSKDIYSEVGSIFRELTKNAYDAYLQIDADELEEEGGERKIVIQRHIVGNKRKILVTDYGIGMDQKGLKGFAQLGVAHKKESVDQATGFRGLGSWSIIGAGSKVRVISTKKGIAKQFTLTFDVRKIYSKLSPTVSLHEILNDSNLLRFEDADHDKNDHFTTIEIICDGKPESVGDYEINRLWDYADPSEKDSLRDILARYCALPYVGQGANYDKINEIYAKTSYVPTSIVLDNEKLERTLPPSLTQLETCTLEVNNKVVAHAWFASDPKKTSVITPEKKHLLPGASIQLVRLNVPIGTPGAYKANNRTTDQWFVGEVHVVDADLLPNAGGDDLRQGTLRDLFVSRLEQFHEDLNKAAELKSEALSLVKKLNKGKKALEAMEAADAANKKLPAGEHIELQSAVKEAAEAIGIASGSTAKGNKIKKLVVSVPDVKETLKEVKKIFKKKGILETFAKPATSAKKKSSPKIDTPTAQQPVGAGAAISLADVSMKLSTLMPKFEQLGLTPTQAQQVHSLVIKALTKAG